MRVTWSVLLQELIPLMERAAWGGTHHVAAASSGLPGAWAGMRPSTLGSDAVRAASGNLVSSPPLASKRMAPPKCGVVVSAAARRVHGAGTAWPSVWPGAPFAEQEGSG